jgi:AraC-like DNA-binding protein
VVPPDLSTYNREFKALRDPGEMKQVESELALGGIHHNWLEMKGFAFGVLACRVDGIALANARTTRSTVWKDGLPDDFVTITRARDGSGHVTLPDGPIDLSAGAAFALSASERFTCHTPDYQDVSLIVVPRTRLRQLGLPEAILWPKGELAVPGSVVDMLFETFHSFALRARTGPALPPRALTSISESLLGLAAAVLEENNPGRLYAEITGFIDDHLHDPALNVAKVAAALHVSKRTLHRAFAEQDQTIAAYIRSARLRRVKRDLDAAAGTGSIREARQRWGFANPGYFARLFQNEFGVMPSDYVRTLR